MVTLTSFSKSQYSEDCQGVNLNWHVFTLTPERSIGLDKGVYPVNIFLISPQKHVLWYTLEAPHQGASKKYSQHMFLWRNEKNINTFGLKKAP